MEHITAKAGHQISVSVENEPGTLADLTCLLGKHEINIYALTLTGGIDHGYVRMVVDAHEKAMAGLHDAGYLVFERDVVLVEIPNEPGSLGKVTQAWAEAGINLEYAYCAGGPSVKHGLIVMRVDNTEKALDLLQA